MPEKNVPDEKIKTRKNVSEENTGVKFIPLFLFADFNLQFDCSPDGEPIPGIPRCRSFNLTDPFQSPERSLPPARHVLHILQSVLLLPKHLFVPGPGLRLAGIFRYVSLDSNSNKLGLFASFPTRIQTVDSKFKNTLFLPINQLFEKETVRSQCPCQPQKNWYYQHLMVTFWQYRSVVNICVECIQE